MSSYSWIGTVVDAVKYTAFATITLLFYDYFVTLRDEVQYIWNGKKTWVFSLFLLNRYTPMIYFIWAMVEMNYPPFTEKVCDKAALVQFIFLVYITLVGQIFFVARLYALSGESWGILVAFTLLTAIQTILGIVFLVLARNAPSFLLPTGPRLVCVPNSQAAFNMRAVYTFVSLGHDTIAFLTLIVLSYSTCGPSSTWPTILKTIIKDSALYFLAVLGSHFLVVLFMIIDPHNLRYLSDAGITPLTQIMVSRLVLSLRKAADRSIDVTDFISDELSFAANPALPVYTRTRVESTGFHKGGTPVLPDACGAIVLSPLSFAYNTNAD